MPHKDPEARRAYLREYAKSNRAKIALWARNSMNKMREEGGERLEKYKEKIRRKNERRKAKAAAWHRERRARIRASNPPPKTRTKEDIRQYRRDRFQKHRKEIQLARKRRYAEDIQFRIAYTLRNRLRMAFSRGYKNGSAVRDLGCSIAELMEHLKGRFRAGMSFENYGEWHIDHIRPLASFDLRDPEQVKAACHFSNLQPLWAEENIRKGARIAPERQQIYNEVVPKQGQRPTGASTDSAMTGFVMERTLHVRTVTTAAA